MSQITNIPSNPAVQRILDNPIQKQIAPTGASAGADTVELSGATPTQQTQNATNFRADKVADIRAQIAAGTYDADGAKFDAAVDKVLGQISK